MNRLKRIVIAAALTALAPALRGDDAWTVTNAMSRRAVFSCADLTFSDGTVDSLGISNNVIGSHGDVASNGNVKMSGGAVVNGDAVAGPGKAVTNSGSSHVTGTKSVAATTENCTPVNLASLVTSVQATNDNSHISLTGQGKNPLGGASHAEFTLSGGDTITLQPGTYYFTKLTVSGGSTITLTGATRILCTGRVDISGGSFVNPQPYRFRLWVSGAGPFTLSGGSSLSGFIYAPSAPSTISSAHLIGSIFASQVTISGGTSHVTRAIDDVAPRVTINQPSEGAVVSDPAHVLVKGTAFDDETPVSVQVNGQNVTVAADGTFQVTLDLTGASPATITAVATDLAGNSNTARVTVTTVPPPALSLTSPAPGSFVNTHLVNLSGGSGNATTVTVNGQAASVSSGSWSFPNFDLGSDGEHTLTIVGTGTGGSTTITPKVTSDTVPPSIQSSTSPAPNTAGWNNSDVTVSFTCLDSVSGIATCPASVTVTTEGTGLTVTRSAVDRAGNSTPLTVTLNIDKTAPHLTFTSRANGDVVADPQLVVSGASDDAVVVAVNSASAAIDNVTATFTAPLALVEGPNTVTAIGTDRAGNSGSASLSLVLDSRPPQLAVTSPAMNACLNANSIDVTGTVSDAHLQDVKVGGVTATVNGNAWTATIPSLAEGRQAFTITATDTLGHSAVASLTVNIDRTTPVIDVSENGAPFTATLVNRAVSLIVRASDASQNVTLSATLDGAAYASGATISAEGSHTLAVTATDCAGLSAQKTLTFAIDSTPPSLSNLRPVSGTIVGSATTTITGTASEAATVSIAGTALSAATDASKNFAIAPPLSEGVNSFTLHAVDAAGNATDAPYAITLRSGAPIVEILENGVPLVSGAVFNRAVTPEVRTTPSDATIVAQLDSQPFTLGTSIAAEAAHTFSATVTDVLGHTASASTTFTIDTHGPAIRIDAPANGAVIDAAQVIVSGDAGDGVAVSVNGVPASLTASHFTVAVPLEAGENAIVATGQDAAGNVSSNSVTVTRAQSTSGVVITYPPDTLTTNRKTTLVTGRVLTPAGLNTLTIEAKAGSQTTGVLAVPHDASGAFAVPDLGLFEGADTVTVTATSKSGATTRAEVHVNVDLTPPAVRILAGSDPLEDGGKYPSAIALTVTATDSASTPVAALQVDGVTVTTPFTVSANGGHTAVAVATDAAHNETRVVRAFSIGTQGSAACVLGNFEPADGAVVTANSVTLIGTSGGASAVSVNGVPATVANGMFRATVELPLEGANSVTITCDANTSKTITLLRVTGAPSITIDTPGEMAPLAAESITVSGTVNGATRVDVNGTAAVISGTTWSASNVHLAGGLNVLAAHAFNTADRIATATRRVVYLKNAPLLSISSPGNGFSTGAASVDVSGTYANLDPSTIQTAAGGTRETHPYSDTSGSFVLRGVPLGAGVQTIAVTGRDALNRSASATVSVTRADGAPSIAIASPLDNSYVSAATVSVSGTYTAAAGSQIDVNGAAATPNAGTFSGSAPLAAGVTPVVARLTQPDNSTAIATALVTRLAGAPSVVQTFPAADATGADSGVVVIVSFTAPMDEASLQAAFSLLNAAGSPVSGQFRLDRDVLSFAPAAALNPGERYTINIKTTARDLAGNALDRDLSGSFTVATTAAAPPQVNALPPSVCGTSVTISGTAPAGAQIQIDYAGAKLFTTAGSTGAFAQIIAISSQSGYYVARVRVVGADGSLSPAAEVPFTVDCAGPVVLSATYDRAANAIAVTFSKPIDLATVSGSVQLQLEDGANVSATAAAGASSSIVVITPGTPDPRDKTLILTVTTSVKDTSGRNLAAKFSQTFTVAQGASGGDGYISGQIIDATNGRRLAGATVAIGTLPSTFSNSNGAYTRPLPEGAYTIHASGDGYTDVWRQVVVAAGRGVVPIDIRLTARGVSATMASVDIDVSHGGDTTITRRATLNIAAGAVSAGTTATLTAVGAQGLAGLLPLGWSPLAAAEVRVGGTVPASMGRLTFRIPAAEVAASGKALTAVAYDASRDVWRVVAPAVAISGDSAQVTFALAPLTEIALVYPDAGTGIASPPAPVAGGVLAGVADACAAGCPAMHATKPFDLNPKIVSPAGSTVATLTIDVSGNPFPSGTAIDALVNEELRLIGGGVQSDVPYSADLILYRTLAGDGAVADFKLTPSEDAGKVPLQIGFDHIQIVPYPGRLDRGTLLGPAGGRVPADATVQVDIPVGATSIALHASAHSISDLSAFGTIDGFQIVAGFTLALDPADSAQTFTALVKPATATFALDASVAGAQLILAEVLPSTPYGRVFRLADRMNGLTTAPVDVAVLPVEGMVRPGQYLLLKALQPIAFAHGGVRLAGSAYISGAEVLASTLGVRDVARAGGIFAVPVVAKPAAPFSLVPVHPSYGQGAAYVAATAPDADQIVAIGDLVFTRQSPSLQHVYVTGVDQVDLLASNGARGISLSTGVTAVFNQTVDGSSVVAATSIVVTDNATGKAVPGAAVANGPAVTWTPAPNPGGQPLAPNATYIVTISGTIRGAFGAPLGASQTLSFSTITQLSSNQIHPERIRITIPDDNGFSVIAGSAGALPTVPPEPNAWRVVALRRGNAFVTQYQVTARPDGGFSLDIGNCDGTVKCADAVTFHDHIDLEILNSVGNVAAILPLMPFVTADHLAFIAPTDVATDFTTDDGVGVHVPVDAFDQPTLVRVARLANDQPFAAVPSVHDEMTFYGGISLTFDCTVDGVAADAAAPPPCVAKKRLDLSIPVPSSPDPTGRNLVLGWLGDSVRGPRIMIVDTVRLENGKLTTADATTGAQSATRKVGALAAPAIAFFTATPASVLGGQSSRLDWSTSNASVTVTDMSTGVVISSAPSGTATVTPSSTTTYRLLAKGDGAVLPQDVTVVVTKQPIGGLLTGADVKKALMGVLRSGAYAVEELSTAGGAVGWMALDGLQGNYDLFSSRWNSLFLSHIYLNEPHGRPIMPAVLNQPFEVVGYDAGTGLQAFSKVYDPLPNTDPGAAYIIPTPKADDAGPYPVLASPMRVDVVDLLAEKVDITSVRNFVVHLDENRIVTVSEDPLDKLPERTHVRLLNVSSGDANKNFAVGTTPLGEFSVTGKVGDRIVIMRGAENVDPAAEISLVFNKAIFSGDGDETAVDTFLHGVFKLEKASKPPAPKPGQPPPQPDFRDINDVVTYRVDSGGLRVKAVLPSTLERGAFYRFTIRPNLADQSATRLTIGQVTQPQGGPTGALTRLFTIQFQVREVPDALTSFNLRQQTGAAPTGVVRDMALNGNTLLIAALDGGILAYDVADPASITSDTPPVGRVDPGSDQFWSIASDEHGRVFATSVGSTFGFIQSFRIDDFYACSSTTEPCQVRAKSASVVSWAPGYGSNVDIATDTALSDRPEGIPRKLQIAVQDSDNNVRYNRSEFMTAYTVLEQQDIGTFKKLKVRIDKESGNQYRLQRITVENLTRDMRWSADAVDDKPAEIDNIVAGENDQLRVVFNERTYGVVSIFGYGVGVFDLNAIESNDVPTPPPANAQTWSERVRLTSAGLGQACNVAGGSDVIQDLSLSGEAALIPSTSSGDITVYGLDIHRGVLDLHLTPPSAPGSIQPVACDDRSPVGLLLSRDSNPRLAALASAFAANSASGGREPVRRFAAIQPYHWTLEAQDNKALSEPKNKDDVPLGARGSVAGTRVIRDYLLVPANEYGLMILDTTKPAGWLGRDNLADIIWVPAGAVSARVIPRTSLAVVVDGEGRVLLVDLSHIDERKWDKDGNQIETGALFNSVSLALSKSRPTDEEGPYGVGAPDPRIIWTSKKGLVNGSIVPVIDPDTGILFAGKLLVDTAAGDNAMTVIAALDPRIQIRADIGKGGLAEIGGIVPLGVDPPKGVLKDGDPNASLGAFRLQLTLPGVIAAKLKGSTLRLALESERVAGAPVEQTPDPFPRAHLRMTTPTGAPEPRSAASFTLQRAIPAGMDDVLRRQRGFNKFISPWVVAIADPRAAKAYNPNVWSTGGSQIDRKSLGCTSCERPDRLKNLVEPEVFEMWSGGRLFSARPEVCTQAGCSGTDTIFQGTKYDYLARGDRLTHRFATIIGDTTRALAVLIAAQHPPVAAGLVQETVYLHSGELETGNVDLDAGGRNDWNVAFDRTYHSRTMGAGLLGLGWSSSIFRSVRALPNGNVEYRDGGGETWLFRPPSALGQPYLRPPGLTLNLVRTLDGFQTIDAKRRVSTFDSLGRLTTESDEFGTSGVTGKGNTIRYLYDLTGRLKTIVDPVGRATTLTYWDDPAANGWKAGRLKGVDDWRHRKIDYDYDDKGRLTTVSLPDFEKPASVRPIIRYGYFDAPAAYTDFVDLGPQLKTITDPEGGGDRVTYAYGSGAQRGKVITETWGTHESVAIDYTDPAKPKVTDALQQERTYTLTAAPADSFSDRVHVSEIVESVPVAAINGSPVGVAKLPSLLGPGVVSGAPQQRKFTFTHPDGMLKTTTLEGVSSTDVSYDSDPTRPPRFDRSTITPLALPDTAAQMPRSALDPISLAMKASSIDGAYTTGITINSQTIERPEAFRNLIEVSRTNDKVKSNEHYNKSGQLDTVDNPKGGNDVDGNGAATTTIDYERDDGDDFRRSLPRSVTRGNLVTRIDNDDKYTIKVTDPRNVTTTTTSDAYGRPIEAIVHGPDVDNADEIYSYDKNGRLHVTTRKQGNKVITTTYGYDLMGRTTSVETTNVSTGNGLTSASTSTTYDLAHHTILTSILPVGALTTRTLDNLGRTVRSQTITNSSTPIEMTYAYDLAGNTVFQADNFVATAWAYDANGRRMAELRQDGTRTIFDHDGFGRVTEVTEKDSANAQVLKQHNTILDAGALESQTIDLGSSGSITTAFGWDGAGRMTGVAVTGGMKPRATHSLFDEVGRLTESKAGGGTLNQVSEIFSHFENVSHTGPLVQSGVGHERGGVGAFKHSFDYNAAGAVVRQQTASLEWSQHFDEAGNLIKSQPPARPETTFDHDARGLVIEEKLPENATNKYDYTAAGALETYHDPTAEDTSNGNDAIGRPTTRHYPDGSTERYTWDGPRLTDYTDRQGRKQVFGYDTAGRLTDVYDTDHNRIDHIDYDAASRINGWTTKDARVEYESFDGAGRPNTTRQIRYKDSSGFGGKQILDQFEQTHGWNALGERTSWTMPGVPASGNWTRSVSPVYDAAGNLETITRTLAGGAVSTLMSAHFRGAGRPGTRTVTTTTGAAIDRTYSYEDDGTGQLTEVRVDAAGTTVAGAHVGYEGLEVNDVQLLGVSGGTRRSHFEYDRRGRLKSSIYGATVPDPSPSVPGAVQEGLNAADFRSSETRTPKLDAATRAILAAKGVDLSAIDPTGVTTGEQTGHKVANVSADGKPPRTVKYENDNKGAQVSDDGEFVYQWDEKGRLVSATEKATSAGTLRRVRYFYDGNNRLVGRRAESASSGETPLNWQLETRTNILSIDGLPAETTFVWDPIADVIVSVLEAGPNGALLKQIIHGGMGYDDPIEVATASKRFYPVYDEAGDGNLQAVLDESGHLIARNLPGDPYGADALDIAGAAVDKVEVHARKDSNGNLQSVEVSVHTTEAMAANTVAAGVRLAAGGAVAPTPAQLADAFTARFTLSPAQWTALTTAPGAQSLSVAVTPTLRAAAWSEALPFLPPPDWAQKSTSVYSSPAFPVEVRDSLAALATFLAGIPSGAENTRVFYQVDNIAMLGRQGGTDDPIAALLAARFQAQPFAEPFTRKFYVRERWLDPLTGRWLSADPVGYVDSSNLYSFCAGDPVNGRDPTGQLDAGSAATQLRLVQELMAEAGPYGIPISLSAMSPAVARALLGAGAKALVPVGVGLAGGLLANWSINRAADLTELHADEYAAQRRLEQTQTMAAQRKRRKAAAPQVPMLPDVTTWSQQIQANPELAPQLTAYHNQEVRARSQRAPVIEDETIPTARPETDLRPLKSHAIVIGHYPDYENAAKKLGVRYFNVPTPIWKAMPGPEKWAANQRFLDRAIARGDDIILATPLERLQPGQGAYYKQELDYLFGKGYVVSPDGRHLIKRVP
jgi:RHS repeat-associated protein